MLATFSRSRGSLIDNAHLALFARLICCQIYQNHLNATQLGFQTLLKSYLMWLIYSIRFCLFLQVFAFFQLIGDEDCDADVVREFLAMRNYVFDEFL